MSSKLIDHMDIEKMPVSTKERLCKILDQKNRWEELGALMKFDEFDIAVSVRIPHDEVCLIS